MCALALLNASLTFRNVWPTPGVEWSGDLSIELAVFVLGLALASRRFGAPPRWLITLAGGDLAAAGHRALRRCHGAGGLRP